MPLARILPAVLLVCSLPAFAQADKVGANKGNTSGSQFIAQNFGTAATPSEPWRLIPKQPADANSEGNSLDRLRIGDSKAFQLKSAGNLRILVPDTDGAVFSRLEGTDADTTCYAIRSYVVARDSKDSDSTHPAGYSTCLPSDRYQVKSAEIRVQSGDR